MEYNKTLAEHITNINFKLDKDQNDLSWYISSSSEDEAGSNTYPKKMKKQQPNQPTTSKLKSVITKNDHTCILPQMALMKTLRPSLTIGQITPALPLLSQQKQGQTKGSKIKTMIRIPCWNIRALNSPLKQKEVKSFTHTKGISIIGLVEVKVRNQNFQKFSKRIFRNWEVVHNILPNSVA